MTDLQSYSTCDLLDKFIHFGTKMSKIGICNSEAHHYLLLQTFKISMIHLRNHVNDSSE